MAPIFRLSFGPKSFVVISDNDMAKQARLGRMWTECTLLSAKTSYRIARFI